MYISELRKVHVQISLIIKFNFEVKFHVLLIAILLNQGLFANFQNFTVILSESAATKYIGLL